MTFLVSNSKFFLFYTKLFITLHLISSDNNFFKLSPEFNLKGILETKFKGFFVLGETLKFEKSQKRDFKHGNSWLSPKNDQIRHFSPKYKEFLFSQKCFHFEKFNGVDSKFNHEVFKFLFKKTTTNIWFSVPQDNCLLCY